MESAKDCIADVRPAVLFREFVLMPPELIGSPALFVDETERRFPDSDLTLPTHRKAMDAQAIVDQRADKHLERPRSQNLELEPRGRERLEVSGIREKRKDFGDRTRQPKFAFQVANFHPGLFDRRKSSSWLVEFVDAIGEQSSDLPQSFGRPVRRGHR